MTIKVDRPVIFFIFFPILYKPPHLTTQRLAILTKSPYEMIVPTEAKRELLGFCFILDQLEFEVAIK